MRVLAFAVLAALVPSAGHAFCGFYAGKADASLFNEASQAIMVRDGKRTVITMLNDYKGALTEFALVVPVPVVLGRDDIRIADKAIFERIDAYSSPRLAEYYDPNPCARWRNEELRNSMAASPDKSGRDGGEVSGVKVEARYSVGEYEIVILSAAQSDGLETWLVQNGYRIPKGASAALKPYINQGMKFFVARVDLKEQAKTGYTFLRPLQFAFETAKFMLPMRLGMINAAGPQDLILYVLTRHGRVESSNYRTVKLPANVELPAWIKSPGEFTRFYKTMFDEQARREDHRVVFTEYFWDMGWCDPCAADPLSVAELREAGVFWLAAEHNDANTPNKRARGQPGAQPAMLTRLHIRFTKDSFPEDLALLETRDRANFQTRYVIRHPWIGAWWERLWCERAGEYYDQVRRRQEREAQTLATLTGWDINDLRRRIAPLP